MYRIVNRKRFISFIIVLIMITAFAVAVIEKNTTSYEVVNYSTYTVCAGDTLWGIARDINPGIDNREIISTIIEMNEWYDNNYIIIPGDVISIPVYEEQ